MGCLDICWTLKKKTSAKQRLRGHFFDGIDNKRRHLVNCQKSGLDTVGSSISIVDLLRNDDASIDDHKYFELQKSDCEIVEILPKWAKIPNLDRQRMSD